MMKLRAIGVFLIGLGLSGCIAAVVAGAAAGMMVYDKRSVSVIEKDARIFHLIHTEIVKDAQFYDSHIDVVSYNQHVLLIGQTPTASLRVLAEKIAYKTPQVRRVYDEITIGEPIPLTQRSKDTWITGEVRSKMITLKGLESGSFRIVTEAGTVYLMGTVTREQADLAVNVARKVKGVKKVVKVFSYIQYT